MKPVVVITAHHGVFFGYAEKTDGDIVELKSARNCLYWDAIVKGFLGLASVGPIGKSRVGPPADIELRDIICVALCTDEAVKVWESAPWN